jgi:hypothetical protein
VKSGASPTGPAKNATTPAKSAAPEKSAAATVRAQPPIF